MLLAVDVGNTHTALGLFDGDRLRADWRLPTREDTTSDELRVLLRDLFASSGEEVARVQGMIISSVVPNLDTVLDELGRRGLGLEPLFVGPGIRTGMPILYDNPHEVGADRIVNAVAAKERYGAPVIILDFGTATTFDVVTPKGEYAGGVIAPGLGISAEALFLRAARLPRVDVRRPVHVIGRNTEESIQAGLFHGYLALVEGLLARIRAELDQETPAVATGGLAAPFGEALAGVRSVDPDLTLQGLRILWGKNRR